MDTTKYGENPVPVDATPYIFSEWENREPQLNQYAQDLFTDFQAKYPNLYGVYGAAKEVIKSALPYVKYIDPAERERFYELSQQEQTRELLFESLNVALLGRWKPLATFGKEVGGAALETFLPKTAKILYGTDISPIASKILRSQRGAVGKKPPEKPSTVSPELKPAPAEGKQEIVEDTWSSIKKLADDWDGIVEKQKRGVRSRELAAKEAQSIGTTLDDVKSIAPGTAMNDSQAIALIQTVKGVATETQTAAIEAITSKTPDSMNKFLEKFLSLGEADPARWGVRTESGRTLSVMNEPISGTNQYLDQFAEALSRSDLTKEQLAAMVATFKTDSDLAAAARIALKPGKIASIMQLWVKGILSGPPTQAANITGNSLYFGLQFPERYAASVVGRILPGKSEIAVSESGAMVKGSILGFRDALRLAGETYMAEESAFAKIMGQPSTSKMEIKNKMTEAFGDNWFGKALQLYDDVLGLLTTRPLLAIDDFAKAIGYRAQLHALTIRETERLGLTGKAAANKVSELLNKPPEAFKEDALKFAQHITFQEELGPVGEATMKIANAAPPIRFILPFVKTPANIFTGFVDRTPFAPFRKAVRANIMAGGARRDLALARIGLGSMLAASTAALVMDGKITGGGPSNKAERAALVRTGWQPFSLKIGDSYYSYSRLEPVGTIIGVAASAAEIMQQINADDIDSDNIATAIVAAFSKNITDKTFLQGITKLSNALSDPDRWGKAYVNQLAGSFVPAASSVISRQSDPELKKVETMLDSIKSRIPGLSGTLPPKRNLWGDPISANTFGPVFISPIRKSDIIDSPADKAIIDNQINIEMPSRFLGGVEMTPKEYDRYVVLQGNELKSNYTGKGLKDTLDELVKSPEFLRESPGSDGGKALKIRQQVHSFREQAKERMLTEFSDLKKAIDMHRIEREQSRQPLY